MGNGLEPAAFRREVAQRAPRQLMGSIGHRIHLLAGAARNLRTRRTDAARTYWGQSGGADWKGNSHWRDSRGPGGPRSGTRSEESTCRCTSASREVATARRRDRIVEWGVGGGADAVRFAPLAREFVAVDVAQDSLDETGRQVGRVCSTPVRSVLVSLDDQSGRISDLHGNVDLFLCFYVLELVPSEAHAREIVRSAFRMLRPEERPSFRPSTGAPRRSHPVGELLP